MKLPYDIPEQALYIGGAVLISWLLSALWAIRMRRKYRMMLAREVSARENAHHQVEAFQRRLEQQTVTPANPGMEPVIRQARAKPKPKKKAAAKAPRRTPKNRPTRFDRIDED